MLRQGIPPLLGKPADWEKGRVAIQEPRRQHQNRDYLKYTIKYFWDLIKNSVAYVLQNIKGSQRKNELQTDCEN